MRQNACALTVPSTPTQTVPSTVTETVTLTSTGGNDSDTAFSTTGICVYFVLVALTQAKATQRSKDTDTCKNAERQHFFLLPFLVIFFFLSYYTMLES